MHPFRRSAKFVSILLIVFLSLIYIPVQSVFAAMIGTKAVLVDEEMQYAREKVRAFLDREDVWTALTAQGIDPLEAKARLDSLSDAEIQQISDRIDQLPAGGGVLEAVAIIAIVLFLVLLILDMIGVTDVFTFINPPPKR
ncbi:MAG: PA2779 family protein [Desulfobacterales bacterium]|nr:MAG: PA2779 family protein [Desulfobacterales bacterium]